MDITFVVGCARSGTSIFGELIRAHPNVMYVYEEKIWRLAETDHHAVSVDDIDPAKRHKIKKWMRMYKRPGKSVVEKNPRFIVKVPFIKHIFPEAKIIHIVRDGRDVSCSLRPGLLGKTFAHTKPPNWRELEANYQGIERCARVYRATMEIAIKDLENIDHLQVKYEDLVVDPIKIAHQVFGHIGLPIHQKVIDFGKDKIQNEMTKSYVAGGQLRWYKRDHKIRIGRYKENLTQEEQELVNKILKPVLDYYGYK